MNQCVPSWDIQENPAPSNKLSIRSNSNSTAPDVPMLDYEVAELTWENGQLAMHGLGPPRVSSKYTTWDKPRANGTLESIVNQATRFPDKPPFTNHHDSVPWFDPNRTAPAASATMGMDAMVPCANNNNDQHTASMQGLGTCMVGSCSVAATTQDADKRARVARVPAGQEWSGKDQSVGASVSVGRDSLQMTLDTYENTIGFGLTSTSLGSAENTISSAGKRKMTATATTADDHDSFCHSRPQRDAEDEDKKKGTGKSSVSNKRSRAAAIHNQSERKRRDKINERMKTLQKLVPNSSKTDKASMLDEVIEHMKQLQAQVSMMQRMNMPAMMLPMAMQQQLQMSMMAPMGMIGMGMGMGVMDHMNSIARPNIPSMSPFLHPSAFMPMASCDGSSDRLPANPMASMPDPLSTFLACQSQPMTMDAYRRMAAMYQQQLQPHSNSRS